MGCCALHQGPAPSQPFPGGSVSGARAEPGERLCPPGEPPLLRWHSGPLWPQHPQTRWRCGVPTEGPSHVTRNTSPPPNRLTSQLPGAALSPPSHGRPSALCAPSPSGTVAACPHSGLGLGGEDTVSQLLSRPSTCWVPENTELNQMLEQRAVTNTKGRPHFFCLLFHFPEMLQDLTAIPRRIKHPTPHVTAQEHAVPHRTAATRDGAGGGQANTSRCTEWLRTSPHTHGTQRRTFLPEPTAVLNTRGVDC